MAASLDQILSGLASGALTESAAAAQLEALTRANPAQRSVMITRVQSDVAAGRLDPMAGRVALAAIDRPMREGEADRTQQTPSETIRSDTVPGEAHTSDPNETLRAQRQLPPSAAHTLKAAAGAQAASPHAATLQPTDNTQVISGRLVRSLEDAEEPRRGELKPGSIVKKRFVVELLLGKGGMGLVFAAIDRRKEEAQDPNPRIALKVLNADFQRHPQSFIALQREARKAQTLAHPNVVTVFDFDRDGDTVYITMELLRGRSLETIVSEARARGVKPEIAMPIIRGAAEGLAYAHRKGIVHSDLKPANIFITEDGTPKILDFGIARAVPSSVTPENQDVFDAGSLGAYTEAYATDEMIDGIDPHPADDMYALGIIGYELLTGHHPYQRHGAPSARHLGIKPPPLNGLRMRGLNMREAKALERCLSLDRRQRPQDAGEFLKLFRGVTMLQKVSIAAAAVLAVVAGYLWYQNHVETSPAIPFAQLPAETQQQFLVTMQDGDQAWQFFQKEANSAALNDALELYAAAYSLHPRNRDAVKALRKSADAMLELAGDDAQARHAAAQYMQGRSDYFLKYPPVVDAAK